MILMSYHILFCSTALANCILNVNVTLWALCPQNLLNFPRCILDTDYIPPFFQSENDELCMKQSSLFTPREKCGMPSEVTHTYLSHRNPTASCIHYQHKLEHIYQAGHHPRHHKPCIHIVQNSAERTET